MRSLYDLRITASAALVAACTFWAAAAGATSSFPGVVQQHYMLMQVAVDPPLGCRLCHVDDSGGVNLRPFGLLLSGTYGVQPYDEGSLRTALAALDAQNSPLAQDIKDGVDPNLEAGNGDPSPAYGCSAASVGRAKGETRSTGVVVLCGIALAVRRGRRRVSRSRQRESNAAARRSKRRLLR
jgi:hypothetical protein